MEQLHLFDIVIAVIVIISVITGLVRGFIKEVVGIGVWIAAIGITYYYYADMYMLLGTKIHNSHLRYVTAMGVLFIGTLISGSVLNMCLSQAIHHSGLSGTDRIFGLVFGLARGVIIVSCMIVVLQLTMLPLDDWIGRSILYKRFDPLVVKFMSFSPTLLNQVHHMSTNVTQHLATRL